MKENPNKEIDLILKLSQLMTKEKITKLKYPRTNPFKPSIKFEPLIKIIKQKPVKK